MNCKPGDLAIIVGSPSNNGLIVEVLGPAIYPHDQTIPCWWVRSLGGLIKAADGPEPWRVPAMVADCGVLDAWLRPISGLHLNETTDEPIAETA